MKTIIVLLSILIIVVLYRTYFYNKEKFTNQNKDECNKNKEEENEIYRKNLFNKSNNYIKYAKFQKNSDCKEFVNQARNGKYDKKYNECYSECIGLKPSKDVQLYCSNGSECDAFCDEVCN